MHAPCWLQRSDENSMKAIFAEDRLVEINYKL